MFGRKIVFNIFFENVYFNFLLSTRQSYLPEVAAYKRESNMSINQPEREKAKIAELQMVGNNLGVDPATVKEIFNIIFKNSKKIQNKCLKNLKTK